MPLFLSINIKKSSPLFFLLQKMVPGEAQTRRYCLLCAALRVTWAPGGKWSCAATGVKSQPVLGAAECVVSPPGCALHSWLLFCLSRCVLSLSPSCVLHCSWFPPGASASSLHHWVPKLLPEWDFFVFCVGDLADLVHLGDFWLLYWHHERLI